MGYLNFVTCMQLEGLYMCMFVFEYTYMYGRTYVWTYIRMHEIMYVRMYCMYIIACSKAN